jgi:hypothetical protein
MSSRATPPSVYCQDFTFVPRGPHEGKRPVPLNRPVNVISTPVPGAGTNGTPAMSRVVVLNTDGQLYLRDIYGRANLHLNGEPVTEARLRHGDRIQLGKIEYEVVATQCGEAAGPSSAPSASPAVEIVTPGGGPPVRVREPVTVIATTHTADVRLPATAGACAMILRLGDVYWLWNLEPASELRVNGQVVTRSELTDGSEMDLGGSALRFRAAAAPPPAAPKPPTTAAKPREAAAPPAKPKAPAAATPFAAKADAPVLVPLTPKTIATPPPAASPSAGSAPRGAAANLRVDQVVGGDDAESIKRWGPLAFAVAAADRPELQTAQPPSEPPPPVSDESPGVGRRLVGILLVVIVLAAIGAGAFLARQYLGR